MPFKRDPSGSRRILQIPASALPRNGDLSLAECCVPDDLGNCFPRAGSLNARAEPTGSQVVVVGITELGTLEVGIESN